MPKQQTFEVAGVDGAREDAGYGGGQGGDGREDGEEVPAIGEAAELVWPGEYGGRSMLHPAPPDGVGTCVSTREE